MDLVQLLNSREICHPTIIEEISSNGDGDLKFVIRGCQWWKETKGDEYEEGKILFCFKQLAYGFMDIEDLRSDSFEEDLEDFSVTEITEPNQIDVYCNHAIDDIMPIIKVIFEFHADSANSTTNPLLYLNTNDTNKISELEKIAKNESFLLFRGPKEYEEIIGKVLKKNNVSFNVLKSDVQLKKC